MVAGFDGKFQALGHSCNIRQGASGLRRCDELPLITGMRICDIASGCGVWIEEEQAFNFAVYSEHAESVTLLLYPPGREQTCHFCNARPGIGADRV